MSTLAYLVVGLLVMGYLVPWAYRQLPPTDLPDDAESTVLLRFIAALTIVTFWFMWPLALVVALTYSYLASLDKTNEES